MAKFKLPGNYSQEIPTTQTIISSPAVAIFLGYTEKNLSDDGQNSSSPLTNLTSLSDYEKHFGAAQSEVNIEILDNTSGLGENISIGFNDLKSKHSLYYAVRSFFDQGGKKCKIISIGSFKKIGETLSLQNFLDGLKIIEDIRENFLLAVPENQNLAGEDFYTLQKTLLDFCRRNKGFVILDMAPYQIENYLGITADYRKNITSDALSFGAVFFPNVVTDYQYFYNDSEIKIKKENQEFKLNDIKESDPVLYEKYKAHLQNFKVHLPPSATLAGAFLKNDETRGIYKTPANIALLKIIKPEILINTVEQNLFSFNEIDGKSINIIKSFTGKGTLIWGSRTLNGNDNEYRYISVRRFANSMVKEVTTFVLAMNITENSNVFWTKIIAVAEIYLKSFFAKGAFAGSTEKSSFYIRCGLIETMTQQNIEDGILNIEIGFAPTRANEFIILQVIFKIPIDLNIPPRSLRSPNHLRKFP